MSTVLTATPNMAARTVALAISRLPAGRAIEIWRTDANGRRRVRVPRGAVSDVAGTYAITDHEAALTGTITYSALGLRTNELTNPSFDVDLAGWSMGDAGATFTRSTALIFRGAAAALLTTGAGVTAFLSRAPGAAVPAAPGETWTISCYARGTGAQVLRIRSDAIGTIASSPKVVMDPAMWKRLVVTSVIPAAVPNIEPQIVQDPSGSIHLDAFMVERTLNEYSYIDTTADDWVTTTTALTDPARPAGPWIHAAGYPTTLATFTAGGIVGSSWRPTRDTGAQLVDVIGRADPIDTGPALARTRAHAVDVRCDDLAAARSLEDLAAAGRTVVIRHNTPGIDSTLTVENIDGPYQDPANPRRWHVILRGRETLTGPYLAETP